jgi:hypothetical protein
MSSFSIGRSARAGENRLLLHLSAPGGGTEAGDPSLCYEGDIHVPDLQIHPSIVPEMPVRDATLTPKRG